MKNRRFDSIASRATGIAIAAGLMTAVAAPAMAAPALTTDLGAVASDPAAAVTQAVGEATGSSETHEWKQSRVTRAVTVEGKPGPAVVQKGDILTYTVTYTADIAATAIKQVADIKPEGFEYVPASATYKTGSGDWVDANKANEYVDTSSGAVVFTSPLPHIWYSKSVTFKWQYRVTDAAKAGEYNTGMIMKWHSADADSNLSDMGPKVTVVEQPVVPGLPGGGTSPSLGSPSSPGMSSDQAKQVFDAAKVVQSFAGK